MVYFRTLTGPCSDTYSDADSVLSVRRLLTTASADTDSVADKVLFGRTLLPDAPADTYFDAEGRF